MYNVREHSYKAMCHAYSNRRIAQNELVRADKKKCEKNSQFNCVMEILYVNAKQMHCLRQHQTDIYVFIFVFVGQNACQMRWASSHCSTLSFANAKQKKERGERGKNNSHGEKARNGGRKYVNDAKEWVKKFSYMHQNSILRYMCSTSYSCAGKCLCIFSRCCRRCFPKETGDSPDD